MPYVFQLSSNLVWDSTLFRNTVQPYKRLTQDPRSEAKLSASDILLNSELAARAVANRCQNMLQVWFFAGLILEGKLWQYWEAENR